jgi:plasmid stabilization system protein ParE
MSQKIRRSDWFIGDLEHYAAWYQVEASWEVAERYLRAVSATVAKLADVPGLGRPARFLAPVLRNLRVYPVERPFEKYLIFISMMKQRVMLKEPFTALATCHGV